MCCSPFLNNCYNKRFFKLSGIFASIGQIPSLHFILFIYWRICLVCTIASQTLLHETVFAVCLDPRCPSNSRHSKLLDHPQYLSRANMVYKSFSIDWTVVSRSGSYVSHMIMSGSSYPSRWLSATTSWHICLASSSVGLRSSNSRLKKHGKVSSEAALLPLYLDLWWPNKIYYFGINTIPYIILTLRFLTSCANTPSLFVQSSSTRNSVEWLSSVSLHPFSALRNTQSLHP